MEKSLIFALLLRGFASLIIEVLLIRELLVTFSGNELSIGIILANWLILIALGSFALGKFADKIKYKIETFTLLQLIISLYLPFAIYLCRTVKNIIGIIPGEAVGIIPIIYCSFFILMPICVSDGAQFSFGCKIYSDFSGKPSTSVGRVYIYESIGAVAGGLIFTYLFIPFFHSLQVALFIALLNLFSAFLLISVFKKLFPLAYSSIGTRIRDTNFKENHKSYTLTICNMGFRNEINKLGVPYGRKSWVVSPSKSNFCERDYIRSLIDGDGSVGMTDKGFPFVSFSVKSEELKKFLWMNLIQIEENSLVHQSFRSRCPSLDICLNHVIL